MRCVLTAVKASIFGRDGPAGLAYSAPPNVLAGFGQRKGLGRERGKRARKVYLPPNKNSGYGLVNREYNRYQLTVNWCKGK